MESTVLLVTPPFTQLNTPYPATAYLKGFLNTKGISSFQCDLGIEVTLEIFSKQGLTAVFKQFDSFTGEWNENLLRIAKLKDAYIRTIDDVIRFLQGKNPTIAHLICKRNFLPEASRFEQTNDLSWAFGIMGTQDKAKHLATLYLEDLSDLIKHCIDPYFGFSRYAERLGRCAHEFDEMYTALKQPLSFVDNLLLEKLKEKIETVKPKLLALSVPFPGNLYAAFRCGEWVKKNHPEIKVAMGGGFANTELRSLTDARVFEFFDFITLDDGESPVEQLLLHIDNKIPASQLKRTFTAVNNEVIFYDNSSCRDYKMTDTGTPDYSDLLLDDYISAMEIINPMHSLWSDGRWNKLTMAHGCYWGKCTFCDTSLDYISRYEPLTASLICDRMETMIAQTGVNGFHFVDEAAPPALMRSLALEIIRRKLVVSWWTNIRFEKSFTRDFCYLLKASGCIGVSGGLEVASDRLLALIQKGITVAQVAKVNRYFTEAGIMVHAYLMYGFPTQTAQETIDSLEMVRQMFKAGILQSAYWHRFAMTAHSPVGLEPDKYLVEKETETIGSFANNDVFYTDKTGTDHEQFGYGLKKSLHNYMHALCIDDPLHTWFDFKVPKTTIAPDYIIKCLQDEGLDAPKQNTRLVFIGVLPEMEIITKSKKGQQWEVASFNFYTNTETVNIRLAAEQGRWLNEILPQISVYNNKMLTLQEVKADYEKAGLEDFDLFWFNKPMNQLYKCGLFVL